MLFRGFLSGGTKVRKRLLASWDPCNFAAGFLVVLMPLQDLLFEW